MNDYIHKTDAFMASLNAQTYRVGGSVRDELLGRRVKDADYIVCGLDLPTLGKALRVAGHAWAPDVKVSKLSLRDGRRAGWRVSGGKLGLIEVVLPRAEFSTGPGHRDFKIVVDHTLSIHEDAIRRDFTFNALYKSITSGTIHDPTNCGLYDLERGYIRTTHPESFRDDPLRTLRALRFVSTLGYDLAASTLEEMREHAEHVTGLSANGYASGTVFTELSKLLMGDDAAKALRLMRDTGVMAVLLPELASMLGFEQGSRYHDMTTDEHVFTAIDHAAKVGAPLEVRMALLFHDSGKPETAWVGDDGRKHYYAKDGTLDHQDVGERIWRGAAERLNVDRKTRERVATLIREHMVSVNKARPAKVAKLRVKLGDEVLSMLFMHRACDAMGKGAGHITAAHIRNVADMEKLRAQMQKDGVPSKISDLQITGEDAIRAKYRGRQIGQALNRVLVKVATQPNERSLSREWQLSQL